MEEIIKVLAKQCGQYGKTAIDVAAGLSVTAIRRQ